MGRTHRLRVPEGQSRRAAERAELVVRRAADCTTSTLTTDPWMMLVGLVERGAERIGWVGSENVDGVPDGFADVDVRPGSGNAGGAGDEEDGMRAEAENLSDVCEAWWTEMNPCWATLMIEMRRG